VGNSTVDLDAEWIRKGQTLRVAPFWVERHCVVPDGFDKGQPFVPSDWQLWCLLNAYRVKPNATFGQLAPAFVYRRSQIILPQKAGKAPYTGARVCVEGVGPALFGGWAEGGEVWDCRDHGCGCGFVYEYAPGEAMGMRWPTPLIQITAFSEEQTDNIYDALRPMIDKGPLHELIPKTGEEFIRLPNDGRIDVVTSSARSRLGQRVTYVPQDETGLWDEPSGMIKVAETQRRGLSGMGGRAEETTNAYDPGQGSVAQRTAEAAAKDIFRFHPLAAEDLDYTVKADREKIHEVVYLGSKWVDLDAIEAEAAEILENDPGQAERFYGNRIVAGEAKAFDLETYKSLAVSGTIEPGRLVTVGFDGSLYNDATGLVVTDVEAGHQVVAGVWEQPRDLPPDAEWMVPVDEVDDTVDFIFKQWDVWRMYCDPPYWQEAVDRWMGKFGDDRVVAWWTNQRKKMAFALREFKTDMRSSVMSHDGNEDLVRHVGNAIRRPTNMRDDDGKFLWMIGKEGAKSVNKIDLAMCAVLSWRARGDAIADGEPKKKRKGRLITF
jgi:hypothetical protein